MTPTITKNKETSMLNLNEIKNILDDQSDYLLNHKSSTIDKSRLTIPSETYVDDVFQNSDRNNRVIKV